MLSYLIFMATLASFYGLMALGLNLMWGMTGLVNLGMVGFFALGAYASALGVTALGWPIGLGFLAALLLTGLVGALASFCLARLRDDYFAIVTLGLAEVIRVVADNEVWLTRGSDGISGIPQPLRTELGAWFNPAYLLLSTTVLLAAWWVLERLRRAPLGRVLRALRDDQHVAATAGKNVLKFKALVSALAGMLAGLAGALYAHYTRYIAPDVFQSIVTVYVFLAVTLGGRGNHGGAVLGAFLVVGFLEGSRFLIDQLPWLSSVQGAALRQVVIGLALLVVLRWRPHGLLPEPRTATRSS